MVDLFAGTGAFSYAFEATGRVETVFANDIAETSKAIYDLNHKTKLVCKDLNDLDVTDVPAHEILTAGFPCQPFSIAGLQKGFQDARSNIFLKIVELIKHHQPRVVLLENVKNLQSHDEGRTFKVIMEKLTGLGYHIKSAVLDTSLISGVPQHRERIYIACFRDKADHDRFSMDFSRVSPRPLTAFLEATVGSDYYYDSRFKVWPIIEAGVTKEIGTNTVYQLRRQYIRENKSGVCPTLTANMGCGGHNVPIIKDSKGIRKLTPRECFNLQGFPSGYKLPSLSNSHLYKLAGNAVSVPVIQLLARRIMALLA